MHRRRCLVFLSALSSQSGSVGAFIFHKKEGVKGRVTRRDRKSRRVSRSPRENRGFFLARGQFLRVAEPPLRLFSFTDSPRPELSQRERDRRAFPRPREGGMLRLLAICTRDSESVFP